MSRPGIIAALWIAGFCVASGWLMRHFPPVNTDEIFIAVHGENLLAGRGARYSLYDDIFAPSVYTFRDAFAQIIEPVYNVWVGLWFKATARSYMGLRGSSLIAGGLALAVFFAIGRALRGPGLGLAFVLAISVSPAFLTASCVTRPEAFLLMVSSLAVWMALRLPESPTWLKSGVGLLLGLSLGIHPNALVLVAGFFVFYGVLDMSAIHRRESLVWLALGIAAGAIGSEWNLDIPRLKLCQQTMFTQLYQPPLLSFLQQPTTLLVSGLHALKTTEAYYYRLSDRWAWDASLMAWRFGIALCVIAGLPRVWQDFKQGMGSRQHSAFVLAWAAAVGTSACLMRKHEAIYELNFYPFLLPAAAGFWGSSSLPRVWQRGIAAAAAVSAGLSFILFVCFIRQMRPHYVPYPEVLHQFQTLVPDTGLKVAAPNIFWPVWDPAKFRDIGAATYSHWYTGGSRAIGSWLGPWQPDIVVLDLTQSHLFMHDQRGAAAVSEALGVPAVSLGTLETGSASEGPLDVYRVNWHPMASSRKGL